MNNFNFFYHLIYKYDIIFSKKMFKNLFEYNVI